MKYNMWTFHDWCLRNHIRHSASIHHSDAEISQVLLHTDSSVTDGCAIISEDIQEDSLYSTRLSYKEDYLFFPTHSSLEIMSECNRMMNLFSDWEQRMLKINLSHGTLSSLLAVFNEQFSFPVTIHQENSLLAFSPDYDHAAENYWNFFISLSLPDLMYGIHKQGSNPDLYASTEPVIIDPSVFAEKQIMLTNIVSPQFGSIRIIAYATDLDFTQGDLALMKLFTKMVSRNLLLHRKPSSQLLIRPDSFFSAYLRTGEFKPDRISPVLKALKWKEADYYTVFRIELRDPSDSLIMDVVYKTLREFCPLCVTVLHKYAIQMICNTSLCDAEKIISILHEMIPMPDFFISQSNYSNDFSSIPELIDQAEKTLSHARLQKIFFLSSEEFISDYLEHKLRNDKKVQSLIHPAIALLKKTDLEQNTSLLETLTVFLSKGQNTSAAAKELQIHRNTMLTRLEKIKALTGITFEDPQEQEILFLSVLLYNSEW